MCGSFVWAPMDDHMRGSELPRGGGNGGRSIQTKAIAPHSSPLSTPSVSSMFRDRLDQAVSWTFLVMWQDSPWVSVATGEGRCDGDHKQQKVNGPATGNHEGILSRGLVICF